MLVGGRGDGWEVMDRVVTVCRSSHLKMNVCASGRSLDLWNLNISCNFLREMSKKGPAACVRTVPVVSQLLNKNCVCLLF